MTPLLMQSLPNSGSTWFAALLAKYVPGCRYYQKEFFNPPCNLKYELILRRRFGSEMMCCYKNIALPGDDQIDDDIARTWGREDYTFTKECNSAFKLATFNEHFDCFVFLRKAENSFPPGRGRVWSFYEHAWFALQEAGHTLSAVGITDRAVEAHGVLERVVLADAARLGVPVIWWEDLFTDPRAVVETLRAVVRVDDGMIDAIAETATVSARRTLVNA